jgi:hypothetical protein
MSQENQTVENEKTLTPEEQQLWNAKAKVRVLLTLWDLGAHESQVKWGELGKRILRAREKMDTYNDVFEQLQEEGAIAISPNKLSRVVELTAKGTEILEHEITSKESQFEFDGQQVSTILTNALLKWVRNQER